MKVKKDDTISEQKQIERKLRESEDRFRSIAENMADWIWEIDGHSASRVGWNRNNEADTQRGQKKAAKYLSAAFIIKINYFYLSSRL